MCLKGNPPGVLLLHGRGEPPPESKDVACALHRASQTNLAATYWQEWYARVEPAYAHLARCSQRLFAERLSIALDRQRGLVVERSTHFVPQHSQGGAQVGARKSTRYTVRGI